MADRDILSDILEGRTWRDDAEALSESMGVVAAVLRSGHDAAPADVRCPVCLRRSHGDAGDSAPCLSCFTGEALERVTEQLAVACGAGMPCVLQRIPSAGTEAYMLVSGFVTSEVERKDLLARLLAQGLAEHEARAVARATPVVRPPAALAMARLATSHLQALVRSAADEDQGTEEILEYELLYEMGRGFGANLTDFGALCEAVLERALKLTSSEAGVLLVVGEDGALETAAVRGEQCLRDDTARPLGEGPASRAARTGRSILSSGFADAARHQRTSSLAVPLTADGQLVGVLCVTETASGRPLAAADLTLMERFADGASAALDNARRYRDASQKVLELVQLNELSQALSADNEADRISYLITSVLDKMFKFDVGGLVLPGRDEHARVVMRADVRPEDMLDLLAHVTGRPLGPGFLDACAIVPQDGKVDETCDRLTAPWNILSAEVSTAGPRAGFLFMASRSPDAFAAVDERLLRAQAAHASLALDKARTYTRLRRDVGRLVAVLSATADAAERTAPGHADRVMEYAMRIGDEMGLPAEDIEVLRFGGLLHDIGKLHVAEEIILKPARLTGDEMLTVREHADVGAGIVDQMEFLDAVVPVVRHHHERWDGGGYPGGLAGEEIPLLARILAVADAFEAMTSDRSYSKALPLSAARIEVERGAGSQFDPGVVAAFLNVLDARIAAGLTGVFAHDAEVPYSWPSRCDGVRGAV